MDDPSRAAATTDVAVDDAALVARSRHEPEAFAELFRRHAAPLTRYVTRRLGPDAAEDVVAETFLVAFQQRHRYDATRADVRPWLFGIATNLVGRHRRTELRQWRALARTGVDPVVEAFTDHSDARVSANAAAARLGAAISALPAGYRDTLLLFAWADLTYEEVAQAHKGAPAAKIAREKQGECRKRTASKRK